MPGVGDHPEVLDRQGVRHPRIEPRVGDYQRRALVDDVLAERVRQRGLPTGVEARCQSIEGRIRQHPLRLVGQGAGVDQHRGPATHVRTDLAARRRIEDGRA
jgi:hypothetical protein